jgi:hypothetical protein
MMRETATPAFVPQGQTHLSFILSEVEQAFRRGRQDEAIGNLIHAVHVAVTKREAMTDEESAAWFRRLTDASGWLR